MNGPSSRAPRTSASSTEPKPSLDFRRPSSPLRSPFWQTLVNAAYKVRSPKAKLTINLKCVSAPQNGNSPSTVRGNLPSETSGYRSCARWMRQGNLWRTLVCEGPKGPGVFIHQRHNFVTSAFPVLHAKSWRKVLLSLKEGSRFDLETCMSATPQ